MSPEIMRDVLELIESELQRRPTPMDFEMAYQVRVAIDRIKFAIKRTEEFGTRTDQMREVGLQLLDALERLQATDRNFQKRFRDRPAVPRSSTERRVNGSSQPSAQNS
jgi:hypothetical protein